MRRVALAVIFVSMLAIAVGYGTAFLPNGVPPAAAFLFAIATAAVMVAVLVLGAIRRHARELGVLWWVFAFCFLVLAVGFSLALRAPAVNADSALWLGLPQGAAIILYVVGILPLLVLPIAYALTFDRTTLSAEELEEVRARIAAMKSAEKSSERQHEEVLR